MLKFSYFLEAWLCWLVFRALPTWIQQLRQTLACFSGLLQLLSVFWYTGIWKTCLMISYLCVEMVKDYWVKVGGADCHLPYYFFANSSWSLRLHLVFLWSKKQVGHQQRVFSLCWLVLINNFFMQLLTFCSCFYNNDIYRILVQRWHTKSQDSQSTDILTKVQ